MTVFYIKVERINGLRQMTGCTESKEYAETQWGLGKYAKVLADSSHAVKTESVKQGLTDAVQALDRGVFVKCTLLSIDAWNNADEGWTWNAWYAVEDDIFFSRDVLDDTRKLLAWMRDKGPLSEASKGKITVEDDGHNIVFSIRSTGEPIYALDYGRHWEFNGL